MFQLAAALLASSNSVLEGVKKEEKYPKTNFYIKIN